MYLPYKMISMLTPNIAFSMAPMAKLVWFAILINTNVRNYTNKEIIEKEKR